MMIGQVLMYFLCCFAAGYTGDLYIFIKLLLPGSIKRIYNVQSRTIVKIFSKIFSTDLDDMMEDLEQVQCRSDCFVVCGMGRAESNFD